MVQFEVSGMSNKGVPIMKCPGVRALNSEGLEDIGTNGREFKHDSIWQRKVDSSSKLRTADLLAFTNKFLALFTADSQMPPKLGE